MREYRHLRRSSFAAQFFIVRFQGVSGVFALTLCQIEYLLSTFALTLCQIEYLCPLVPSEFSGKSVKIEYLCPLVHPEFSGKTLSLNLFSLTCDAALSESILSLATQFFP